MAFNHFFLLQSRVVKEIQKMWHKISYNCGNHTNTHLKLDFLTILENCELFQGMMRFCKNDMRKELL